MQEQEIGAVIVCGYSDLGRLRIIRWCRRHGIPCFISADSNIRCDYARGIVLWAKRILVGWCIRNTAGLLPFGSLGQQFFEKYGANPDRIWFFPLEPDYALIENLSQDRIDRVRKKFGWNPLRRRLVFSGRLIGLKRVDLLIDAFNVVAPQRQDWDLVIVGDGPLRGALESRLMPSIADRVIWAGFQPEQADVAAIYRCCDVLVLPSDYEAWGLVVNEAMTAGLALVCSNIVGATAELVHNGENGYAFVRGDGDALIRAMMNITEPKNTEKLRRGSALILKSWRQEGNPISGLRRALETTLAHKWASAAADQFNHSPDRASAAGASDC
jgi:glycosyltransferase involved in cell wall biosynthesis